MIESGLVSAKFGLRLPQRRSEAPQLFPELVDTIEGRAKIERSVWDIMKSIDEEGLRFVD